MKRLLIAPTMRSTGLQRKEGTLNAFFTFFTAALRDKFTMKSLQMTRAIFLVFHLKASLEVSPSMTRDAAEPLRTLKTGGSSEQLMHFVQPRIAHNIERHTFEANIIANDRKGTKGKILLKGSKSGQEGLYKPAQGKEFDNVFGYKAPIFFPLNQEKIQKISENYKRMKRPFNLIMNNESPLIEYLSTPTNGNYKWKFSAEAREIRYRAPLARSSKQKQRNYGEGHRNYPAKTPDLTNTLQLFFKEMDKIDKAVADFVETGLPKLADFASASINKPEISNSHSEWTKLPQHLKFLGLDSDQLALLRVVAASEEVQPGHIVDKIIEMKISDVARELNTLLRNLNSLSKAVERSRHEDQLSLETRVLFETHIFQTLNFLYENQLWDQKMLRMFFSTEKILEITYEHLQNLFKIRRRPGQSFYFALMPELSFVLNDWNTAHMHGLLRDLDKAQQARLVELMLIGAIESFKTSYHFHESSSEIKTIIDAVTEDRILKHWWLNDSPNSLEEEAAKKWILHLVTFFGETGDSNKGFEYLISYYLYNFTRTYQISHFPTLPFNNLKENIILDTKFKVFQAGIRLHEAFNRLLDYKHLVELPHFQKDYLPTDVTAQTVKSAKKEMLKKADEYKVTKETSKIFAPEAQVISNWMKKNSLISFYDTLLFSKLRRNMWSFGEISSKQSKIHYYLIPSRGH
ncbi:hypothetical protein O181_039977 [Austropuccinia psidii MF-1]|uniref:Uncharacterized protein n=1 Tax=Austropuccinia psidii MF-1 TaxID=1389203 RepID=A0A9Q3HDE9_9BASI|nr:hypothetical protein [Austropuccinia psidii MF-1]